MKPFVVLCMAGRYRRFRDAGYTLPKYLLVARDRRVLDHVIDGLAPDRLLLVANEADRAHEAAIRECASERTGRPAPLVELVWVGDTSGQAETAAIGARWLVERGVGGPILFHNVDTVVRGRDLPTIGVILGRADGFVDTFPNDSPAFSYVAVDGRRVIDIAEKVVISRHATSGLYGFRSADGYLRALAAAKPSGTEFYVSDVYREMLRAGQTVEIGPDDAGHETIVLGTPAEYEAWR